MNELARFLEHCCDKPDQSKRSMLEAVANKGGWELG